MMKKKIVYDGDVPEAVYYGESGELRFVKGKPLSVLESDYKDLITSKEFSDVKTKKVKK